tara:strand:+ start:11115 stop:11729 length:615 start_codon:yes stop_codon:yes gene_type:complete
MSGTTKFLLSLFIICSIFLNPINTLAEDIVLGGGCFWCLEHDLESLQGVESVVSGYSGGDLINPSYENHEGHQEVVLVKYDTEVVDVDEILRLYFRNIDPLDREGQFCDRGDSYRPIIFYQNEEENNKSKIALISASKELNVIPENIKVELKERGEFWVAEDYHQDFANNNELKYKFYRFACGRDKRLDQLWGMNARSSNKWSG